MGAEHSMIRWAADDAAEGAGLAFFDFSGSQAYELLARIPPQRWNDVVFWNIADREFPIGWNVLHGIKQDDQPRVVNKVLDTFHALFPAKIVTVNVDQYIQATSPRC